RVGRSPFRQFLCRFDAGRVFALRLGKPFHDLFNLFCCWSLIASKEIEHYCFDPSPTRVNGSTRAPCARIAQCKCGPVTRPVAPGIVTENGSSQSGSVVITL